jgi:hypothetical protein
MFTNVESAEFELLARPIIKWLNEHGNPHSVVIIDTNSAQILSGEVGIHINDYIQD